MKHISFSKIAFSIIACLFFIATFTTDAEAQRRGRYGNPSEFMFSAGATAIFPRYSDELFKELSEEYFGVTFSPRLNLVMGSDQSMSLALYLSVLNGKYINKAGDEKDWSYEMPFVINFNFGAGATHSSRQSFGGFLGLGYQFSNLYLINPEEFNIVFDPNNPSAGASISEDGLSPMEGFYLNGGFRFLIGSGTGNIHVFLVNTKIKKQTTLGIRFLYTFGDGRGYR